MLKKVRSRISCQKKICQGWSLESIIIIILLLATLGVTWLSEALVDATQAVVASLWRFGIFSWHHPRADHRERLGASGVGAVGIEK